MVLFGPESVVGGMTSRTPALAEEFLSQSKFTCKWVEDTLGVGVGPKDGVGFCPFANENRSRPPSYVAPRCPELPDIGSPNGPSKSLLPLQGSAGQRQTLAGGVGCLARWNLPQGSGHREGDELVHCIFVWVIGIFFGSI